MEWLQGIYKGGKPLPADAAKPKARGLLTGEHDHFNRLMRFVACIPQCSNRGNPSNHP